MTDPTNGLATSQAPIKRRVILNHPPASSPWHLPAGTSLLTSVLRREGHDVIQRYGHIIGIEHVLKAKDQKGTEEALAKIQDRNSSILDLYNSRTALERISTSIVTDDKFIIERNNVHYAAALDDGTIPSLLKLIKNRESSMWHDYFARVEVPLAREYKPDVYGISINDERQIVPGCILASMVKEVCPETLVVLGGNVWSKMHHAFKLHEFAKLFDFCDTIVYSEGFEPLRQLVETLDPWPIPYKVPGVVYRMFGQVVVHEKSDKPVEFTTLPTPSYDGGARQWCPDTVMPLYTASNCPQKCAYCAIAGGSDTFLEHPRYMTPQQIAAQMKELALFGNRFDITDETFSISRQISLGKALREIGHEATWQCYLTITNHLLDKGICGALYKSGCRAVQLGLETLSPRSLAQENKGWNTPEDYGQILQNLTEAGIQVHVFIIAGIPGEPMTQMLKWLPFIEDFGDYILTIKPARYRLTRMSPEEQGLSPMLRNRLAAQIEVLPDTAPLRLNREFRYKNERSLRHDLQATLTLINEACRQHWAYTITSTIPWWINRGCYTFTELKEMSKLLPQEPETPHLPYAIRRARSIVKVEMGKDVQFGSYDDVVKFFRPLL